MLFNDSSVEGIVPRDEAHEAVLSGAPSSRCWHVTMEDGSAGGIRETRPGAFRYTCAAREFTHILCGHAVLRQEGGANFRIGPGDSFTLRPGFRGVWEVTETIRREFVTGP